jgi:glycosyltransferase involved in cell wall biosynthesis
LQQQAQLNSLKRDSRNPAVSIVVVCYNQLRFLRQRLTTIEAQGLHEVELILVDDRSTDGSSEWLRDYAHAKGALFLQPDRRLACPVKTWSLGVSSARGKWVWLAEADDLAAPTFLETLYNIAEAGDKYDFLYCASVKVDAGNVIYGDYQPPYEAAGIRPLSSPCLLVPGRSLLRTFLQGNPVPNVSACLFRAEALRPVLESPEDLYLSGDWWVYCQIALKSGLCYVPKVLNGHRCHTNSVRAEAERSWVRVKERYRVLQLIKKRFHPSDKDWEDALHSAFKDFAFARCSKAAQSIGSALEDFRAIEATDPRFLSRLLFWRTSPRWCELCSWFRVRGWQGGVSRALVKGVYQIRPIEAVADHEFKSIVPRGFPGFWFESNFSVYCDLSREDSRAFQGVAGTIQCFLFSKLDFYWTPESPIARLGIFDRFHFWIIGTHLGHWVHNVFKNVLVLRFFFRVRCIIGFSQWNRPQSPYIVFGLRS